MNTTGNVCPVCGYDDMEFPYGFGEICSCCGTLFGEDDAETSHSQLRHRWIMRGAPWFSRYVSRPQYWSAPQQLRNIEYILTDEERESLGTGERHLAATSGKRSG
jgi:hypothetical protein